MDKREETLREIIRGLEGLALLGKWEVSLAEDLRTKAASLLDRGKGKPPRADDPAGRPR
jgi:hypothetical protein